MSGGQLRRRLDEDRLVLLRIGREERRVMAQQRDDENTAEAHDGGGAAEVGQRGDKGDQPSTASAGATASEIPVLRTIVADMRKRLMVPCLY